MGFFFGYVYVNFIKIIMIMLQFMLSEAINQSNYLKFQYVMICNLLECILYKLSIFKVTLGQTIGFHNIRKGQANIYSFGKCSLSSVAATLLKSWIWMEFSQWYKH